MENTPPPRLTMHDVLQVVRETLNLDRGILRTLVDLFVRPRTLVETYFFVDREKYSKPATLLLLMLAAVVFSCQYFLPPSNFYSPNPLLRIAASNEAELRTLTWLREYDDVLRLLLLPATSVLCYLLFRKQKWNFAEHLAFNAYVLSIQFFILAVLLPMAGLKYEWIAGIAIVAYFLVTYSRCMNGPWPLTLLKATVVLVGANLLFVVIFYPIALWLMY